MNKTYYWGKPDTSVHFCESKYNTLDWIAEYQNTISAISYLIVGIFFLFSKKLRNIGYMICALGISTMIMHGTLRHYGQWLDETSMLMLSYETIIYLNPSVNRLWLPVILGIYTYHIETFWLFATIFLIMQLYILYLALSRETNHNRYKTIALDLYVASFVIALVFWILDQTMCSYMGNVNGHAIWHIGTASAMFFGYLSLLL